MSWEETIKEHQDVMKATMSQCRSDAENALSLIKEALRKGCKVLTCGNGGSAAQAQHLAAELVVRFEKDREALPAISLTTDTSNLTAAGNDYGFEKVFSRQVEALGNQGDVLVGITTSGNSENVLEALKTAKRKGLKTICLNGKAGGAVNDLGVDVNIVVPSRNTARIQEAHITIIHWWCRCVEQG